MIFTALHRFAESRGLLDDLDFTEQTIHACVDLDSRGNLIGVFALGDREHPVKKAVSRISNRNSAAIAYLGADQANRVIPELDPSAKRLVVETQSAFLAQLTGAQRSLNHSGLEAVVTFCSKLHAEAEVRKLAISQFERLKLNVFDWITFSVENYDGYLVEWPEIKDWWRSTRTAAKLRKTNKKSFPCMVTGKPCIPVDTHGPRIKVAPQKKQTNVALVSADKPAFGSYGFKKALVSPMSEEAVEGYIRAVNWLGDKAHSEHHYRTAYTIYLFWCDRPELPVNPAKAIEEGDASLNDNWFLTDSSAAPTDATPIAPVTDSPQAAADVFHAPTAGKLKAGAGFASARFYCLALSGSSARGIIRDWIDQPLPAAVTHMQEWFTDLSIPLDRALYDPRDAKIKDPKKRRCLASTGDLWSRWPLWRLVSALEGKGDSSSAEVTRLRTQLFDCALRGRGHPVPLELLTTACRRIASTGDCPPPRAALIQLLLRRRLYQQPELNLTAMPEIDQHLQQSAAFACGRLLRALQGIQSKALGDRNASVVDKFYASASATPAAVLGGLVAKAQPHLAKVRKEQPGLAHWFDEQLTDIIARIVEAGGFPATSDPTAQGEFALGFYYQRVLARKQKPDADDADLPEDPAA